MGYYFTNENGESTPLGTISMNFLNERDVFDESNEDDDYLSSVIYTCSDSDKLNDMSYKIDAVKHDVVEIVGLNKNMGGEGLHKDYLIKKMTALSELCRRSKSITCEG